MNKTFNPALSEKDMTRLYTKDEINIETKPTDKPKDIHSESEYDLASFKRKFAKLVSSRKKFVEVLNRIPTAVKHGEKLAELISAAGDDNAYKKVLSFVKKLRKLKDQIAFKKITAVSIIRSELEDLNCRLQTITLNEDKLKYLDKSSEEIGVLEFVEIPNKPDTMFWVEAPIVFVLDMLSKSNQTKLANGIGLKKMSNNYFVIKNIPFLIVKTSAIRTDITLEEQVNVVIQTLNRRKKSQGFYPIHSLSRTINGKRAILLCKEEFASSLEELVNNTRSFQIYLK